MTTAAPSLVGWAHRLDAMADYLTIPDGGFTVDTVTGKAVSTGYAVSIYAEREAQITGPVTYGDLLVYMLTNDDLLSERENYFGGWRDPNTGAAYLDVTTVVPTLDAAMFLARQHGQTAVYDFAQMASVPVS